MKKAIIPIAAFLMPLCSMAQWTTIDTDPSGDSNGLDGTTLEYQYDQSLDQVQFRVTTTNLASFSTGPAADFSFQLPNGLESGAASGTHWTSSTPVHKTAYIYCDAGGSAPSNYTYSSWSQRIEETSTMNSLCSNCVTINADVPNNQITYTFDRKDIITDVEMGGSNTATIVLVHNLGHDVGWDDNITETGSFTITTSNVSEEEQIEVVELSVYPSPGSNSISIDADLNYDKVVLYDLTGKEVAVFDSGNEETMEIASLAKGDYLVNVYHSEKLVGKARFSKS